MIWAAIKKSVANARVACDKSNVVIEMQQYKLLDSYLEYKYYMPEITKVYSIKDNMRGGGRGFRP